MQTQASAETAPGTQKLRRTSSPWRRRRLAAGLCFWLVAFGICLGLGYPTLNRYDPRRVGNVDAGYYYTLVQHSPLQAQLGHRRYRVLVPYLAKPIYWAAKGRVGSWDAVFLALLVVNAALVASTVLLLYLLCIRLGTDPAVGLVAGCLYLLDFAVPNEQLAAMVDSSEGFLVVALVAALLSGRWYWLPLLGVAGALGKETFIILGAALAGTWWLCERPRRRIGSLAWVAGLVIAGAAASTVVHSAVRGVLIWPHDVAASESSPAPFFPALARSLVTPAFWYPFAWLLPLGAWRLRGMPRPWVLGTAASVATALLLGAYTNAGGNVGRAVFNVAGPLLAVAAAMAVVELARRAEGEGRPIVAVASDGS